MFSQSMYSVKEDEGPAQAVLVLSNPSSMDFNVTVFNIDASATGGSTIGEPCSILINLCINSIINMLQEEVLIMFLDHTLLHFLLE